MSHLRTLSLHFHSSAPWPVSAGLPPDPSEHVILLALTSLKYRGTSEYLDSLAARIDAPRLGNIDITFFSQPPPMEPPQLGRFINRIAMQKSHRRADILFSKHAISISFTHPESPTCLELQVSCESFSQQLSSMARICNGLYSFLLGIEHLRVRATRPTTEHDHNVLEWQRILRHFKGTKWAYVTCGHSTSIILALQHSEMRHETLLPALHKVRIQEPDSSLQKVVLSFIHSRLRSGHIIAVEYGRSKFHELHGTGSFCRNQQAMIEMLSVDILVNIIHHYLYSSPQDWPTLTHVCRSWRQIISRYPLGLDLRLYCTYGIPVQNALECWPPFPLVVKYGGYPGLDPPTLEDDDNIIASLKESGRVSSISLTVTRSLIEKLPAITEPLSGLEELVLLSRDSVQLALPSVFRWGSRLCTLHSTRVAIPSFPRLLLPCHDLTDLQLHEIPNAGYFSPEEFANALSMVTQLRILSLHFLSFPSRRKYLALPPPSEERVVLPALTCFKYRGTSKYLDNFVARIDAPCLRDIDITCFSQPTMDASQLGRFIGRIEMPTPLSGAEVQISVHAISVAFLDQSTAIPLRVQIPCKQLDWQLSSMAQIFNHFSPFLFRVEDLRISSTQSLHVEDGMAGGQWLELIHAFSGAKDFHVAGVHVMDMLCALRPAHGNHTTDTVLPTLRNIHVYEHMPMDMPLWIAAESFLASRQFSGHPVELYADVSCHICNSRFIRQHELKKHLVDDHFYQIYRGDSECKPEHLASRHPEDARTNAHILNHVPPHCFGSHGTGRPASDIFGPFTRLQSPSRSTSPSPIIFPDTIRERSDIDDFFESLEDAGSWATR
ncbi:hypothetical protein V8E53_006352 [Lactarius tabidus]